MGGRDDVCVASTSCHLPSTSPSSSPVGKKVYTMVVSKLYSVNPGNTSMEDGTPKWKDPGSLGDFVFPMPLGPSTASDFYMQESE